MSKAASSKTEVTPKTSAPKAETESIPKGFEEDFAKAKLARERRRPGLSKLTSSGLRKSPRALLREQYAPESFGKSESRVVNGVSRMVEVEAPKEHVFFTDSTAQTRRTQLNKGAFPVVVDGEQVMDGNDVMWRIPNEFNVAELEAAATESKARLSAAKTKGKIADGVDEQVEITQGMGEG